MSVKNITKSLILSLVLIFGISTQNCLGGQDKIVHYKGPDTDHYPEDKSLVPFTDTKTTLIGYKDKKGHTVIPAQFMHAGNFSKYGVTSVWVGMQGYWGASDGIKSDGWYMLHKSGKVLVKSYYFDNGADYFVQGLSRFEENGKIGFIDKTGKIVIPAKFDWARSFGFTAPITTVCQGCKAVKEEGEEYSQIKGGKWGLINHQGKVVIPMEYDGMTTLGMNDDARPMLIKGDKHYLVIKAGNTYKVKEVQVEKGEDNRWKLKG